ncbi:MAG: hypothetical protein J6U54_19220 [Clostridiales bacterium]|nr:hypothetical protein [Clostridiales bacterium]
MFDNHWKQFIGLFMSIASLVVTYVSISFGISEARSIPLFLIFLVIGFIFGIVGLVFAIISLKKAKDEGTSKGKSIAGLIISIYSLISCGAIGIFIGFVFMLVTESGAA